MKIVLAEENAHKAVETRYLSEMGKIAAMGEKYLSEARQEIMNTAENKEIMSIALELKACKGVRKCMDRVRDKVIGPKVIKEVTELEASNKITKNKIAVAEATDKNKIAVAEATDPAVTKRILQIYAAKRESFNLLKNELDLIQGLARLLTGEPLEDQNAVNLETNILVAQAREQSRDTVVNLVKLGLTPKPALMVEAEKLAARKALAENRTITQKDVEAIMGPKKQMVGIEIPTVHDARVLMRTKLRRYLFHFPWHFSNIYMLYKANFYYLVWQLQRPLWLLFF